MKFQHNLDNIELRAIGDLGRPEQLEILRIRNQTSVRNNMYTKHVIQEDEHFSWIDRLAESQTTLFLSVLVAGSVAGGVIFRNIDRDAERADLGFYLNSAMHGRGLGAALIFKAMDHAVFEIGLEKLNLEVLGFNATAIKLNRSLGFLEEGILRNHIRREGELFDVLLFGLTADEWKAQRARILHPAPHDASYYDQIIDEIQQVRGRNNSNWMDLMRLCFKENPEKAADIVSEILRVQTQSNC